MTDIKSIAAKLAPVVPALATVLGGPAGGAVAAAIVKGLGLNSTDDIASLPPEELQRLDDTAKEIQLAQIKSDTDIALAQIANNTQDSKSSSLFVAGWRPAIGWVCGVGLAYQFIARPLGNAAVVVYLEGPMIVDGAPYDVFPAIDIASLSALLVGMLGLGAKRTVEKIKRVARNRINDG